MAVQIAKVSNGRLKVDSESLEKILDKASTYPVAVIAVSGPLHKGKSNILNRLLDYLAGSKDNLRQTNMADVHWKTKADRPNEIQMWPYPLMTIHNGRNIAVFLMSVHVNLDNTIDSMDNALILAFGCLLSTVTIYQIKNGLSEDMLQVLQMTISNAKAVMQQKYCNPFAKLLFVINDWQFPNDYVFGYHEDLSVSTMRNLKMDMLDIRSEMTAENRTVRQEILSSFREVCCCLVPYFNDDVVKGVDPLTDLGNWIFRDGNPIHKSMNGAEVTGTRLKNYMQKWTASMASSRIYPFRTEVEVTKDLSTAVALSVALKFFKMEIIEGLKGHLNLSVDQIHEIQTEKKKSALSLFQNMTNVEVLERWKGVLEAEFSETLTFPIIDDKYEQPQQPQQPQPPQPLASQTVIMQEPDFMVSQRKKNRKYLKLFLGFILLNFIVGILWGIIRNT